MGALYKVGTAVFILLSPCEETQQDVPCSEGRGSLELGFALWPALLFTLPQAVMLGAIWVRSGL